MSGFIRIKGYPETQIPFELPPVDHQTEIHIHFVRVYNDGDTIISVVRLEINGTYSYYTAVTNATTSYVTEGLYYGYLIRRSDEEDEKDQNHGDSQTFKKRIHTVFENMTIYDTRLPKQFQKGTQNKNYSGHNGIRIYQPNMKAKAMRGWNRLEGGNCLIHVANTALEVRGCEGLGMKAGKITRLDGSGPYYGVVNSAKAMGDFLNKIITTFEEDIKINKATLLTIEVEDNIQYSIKEYDSIDPEQLYTKLYQPRKKAQTIQLEPQGIKPISK